MCLETTKECEEKELRMTGGRVTRNGETYYMAGTFEMCVNGQWATVCQNQWRDSEATVACRQLGLHYTGSMLIYFYKIFHCLCDREAFTDLVLWQNTMMFKIVWQCDVYM